MNEELLICYLLVTCFLLLKLKFYGVTSFFQVLLSVFILITLATPVYLVYDNWLNAKISNREIQNLFDMTYTDINNLTTLHKIKNDPRNSFPNDKIDEDRNKKILRDSLLLGLIPMFTLIVVLYYKDHNFYGNLYKSLLSIFIVYFVELYFSWAITSDFKGEGLESLRHDIVKSFEDKTYVIDI